jgi:DNA-nicking Smr family endonuclease
MVMYVHARSARIIRRRRAVTRGRKRRRDSAVAMARRKKRPARPESDKARKTESPSASFPSPFKNLKRLVADRAMKTAQEAVAPKALPEPPPHSVASEPDDESVLRQAYADVRPLRRSGRRVPVEPTASRAPTTSSEEAEVLAQLYDLVSGQGAFDLTETEEYVEGARVGLDPRLVTRLRRGEFAVQRHIDLHGMVQPAAKEALTAFILDSVSKGARSVLVVHGRGRGSPGGRPILKHAAVQWLSRGVIGGHVLAFTTARPRDGGAGAMYVLLRIERRRARFDVLHGTKRRD